ncbi:2Fe-2S ferredoxin [Nosema bombycis CQ1]|uniref:2Fe-2S ferredoxin n=1 Tax=Nosema bombycis (strain CQ1 / CVCC 102059) TaxID=578461 RepID=R0KWX5_NOSB1|nr:2Fe-2S ferredoxin [Nosema bombycis CQ1]|eukprot:EOB14732.1 2Fe-2S ferredoxin [Nosema bombycis CQ1]
MPELIKFFFSKLGNIFEVLSPKGPSLLEVAHKNKIELEGACEGSLACSTCHVILDKDLFNKLGEPTDREYDLIDQLTNPEVLVD